MIKFLVVTLAVLFQLNSTISGNGQAIRLDSIIYYYYYIGQHLEVKHNHRRSSSKYLLLISYHYALAENWSSSVYEPHPQPTIGQCAWKKWINNHRHQCHSSIYNIIHNFRSLAAGCWLCTQNGDWWGGLKCFVSSVKQRWWPYRSYQTMNMPTLLTDTPGAVHIFFLQK